MKIAVVAPSSVPFVLGGAERLWNGLVHALNEDGRHAAELIKLPTREHSLPDLVASYATWMRLDLGHFDMVVSTKYPAWMVEHDNHVVYLQHTLRGLYDTYPLHLGAFRPKEPELLDLAGAMQAAHDRRGLDAMVDCFRAAMAKLGESHPAFAFPGPLARELVQRFDRVGLGPRSVRRHLAISATVAGRPGYFPPGVPVEVVRHPSDLQGFQCRSFDYFFTASRLEAPKRVDLLIQAMRHVRADVRLRIAGTGPAEEHLRALAEGDERVEFLGYVNETHLVDLYADALAVPFVPRDEDLGLITLEAMRSGKPVVTTTDSGGPTELVVDSVNGFVTSPDPKALGAAMTRLAVEPDLARRLGERARSTGNAVTWRRVVAALLRTAPPGRGRPVTRSDRPRIVVTSTFPVHPRLGGGQLRCFHLYGAMTERFDIEIVSLTGPADEPISVGLGERFTETVVPKSPEHERREQAVHAEVGVPITDIVAGSLIEHTPSYLEALEEATKGAAAVLLAHPFLLRAVDLVAPGIPLVYDAHNAEFQLKASILPETPTGAELLMAVRRIEADATTRASLVSVCSSEDLDALATAFHPPLDRLCVVANGVDTERIPFTPWEERAANRAAWMRRFADLGRHNPDAPLALFAGSWHLPNIDAAEHIFYLAELMPDVVFLLVGSHGDYFGHWMRTPPNVVRLGIVSERHKEVLLRTASVALNPMARGSGTNLKIVEYFAAGIPVVSTPLGARGLAVEPDHHLSVAELDDFPAALRRVFDDPDGAYSMARRARAVVEENYDWRELGRRLAGSIATAVVDRAGG